MKLLKQYNVPKLGAFTDSLFTSFPVLSLVNFFSIAVVLYATISGRLSTLAPWLTFWMFIGLVGLLITVTMILIYKFVLPSVWTFRNKQMNRFESDILKGIKVLRKEIRVLRKEVKVLRKEVRSEAEVDS